jgi:hypothetical protein
MCGRGSSVPRIVDWPPGIGSGQRCVRSASPSSRGGLILLDDAGGDPAAVAEIYLVVGATDPGPGRFIRRSAVEILVEDGVIVAAVMASISAMGYLWGADHLSCRDQPQRPGRRPRPPIPGSQTGSQRRQALGHITRQPAMVCAARWPIRPRPATCGDAADAPEKRKVGGSTPPLTTSQLATCGSVTRKNVFCRLICSASLLTVAARTRPSFAVRWGTRGARSATRGSDDHPCGTAP